MKKLKPICRKELIELINKDKLHSESSRNNDNYIMDELEYRDFTYIKDFPPIKFEGLSLKGSSFVGVNLQGINFVRTDLESVNFTGANLRHAHFLKISSFQDTQFVLSKIGNSSFSECDLSNADFTNTIFLEDNPNKNKKGELLRAKFAHVIYDKITASDEFMSYIRVESYRDSRCKKLPRVMICYAWGTDDSKRWVVELGEKLRKDGVDLRADFWEVHPGDHLPHFMEVNIADSDFVLCICTPEYKKRFDERVDGVGYEAGQIAAELFINSDHRKFIPILQSGTFKTSMPNAIKATYCIDLSNSDLFDEKYKELLDTIFKKRDIGPPIGNVSKRYQ